MKDYASMSDFEVNKAVLRLVIDYEDIATDPKDNTGGVWFGDGAKWYQFNPCCNVADAWPVIFENKIWLRELFGTWQARGFPTKNHPMSEVMCEHANPLRAAMVVFLKMKDKGSHHE